jgi:hypothetical protein
LADDLSHPSARETKASYSVGGLYDMKLRVDTEFGAYRITTYEESLDIVENTNLWAWVFDDDNVTARAYEYGLISETFKLANAPGVAVVRNSEFLDALPNAEQQIREFKRNVGFAPRSTTGSGAGGTAMLYWASGRGAADPATSEYIKVVEFDGFTGSYVTRPSIQRQWNWVGLHSPSASYFLYGAVDNYPPNVSPTNPVNQTLEFNGLTVAAGAFTNDNYLNGAQELTENVSIFESGEAVYGNFSTYRSAWKDNTGYILRNDGVGPFFRIKSFYRTEGSVGVPVTNIRKMQDLQGPTKLDGELVTMSTGVYFLNNSGSVSKFDPEASVWQTGGPGVNSLLYRGLQDTTVVGYDDPANTLRASSDGDKRAYLSFDYSANAFLRFNETDLTFVNLGGRPTGEQLVMGVY